MLLKFDSVLQATLRTELVRARNDRLYEKMLYKIFIEKSTIELRELDGCIPTLR